MKKLLIGAAALALTATSTTAQYGPPVSERGYDRCEARFQRLREFEYRVQRDGRVSRDEDRIARSLRADLAANCGGSRRLPRRGRSYD